MTSSKDVIGQAQTGTGKTAAFGIPLVEKVNARKKYPQALVLTPTRELAIQVAEEISSFSGSKRIQTAVVYGGSSMSQQIRTLRAGAQIVVGTPGRVIDHIKRGTLKVDQLDFFVLDEADEMLNMGFLEDIEYVLQQTNEDKQMLYFSATMPKEIKKIAEAYMKPGYEVIKTKAQQLTANNVDQIYFQVNDRDKVEALTRIIDIEQDMYAVIFCRTKLECDQLSDTLRGRGYLVDALHGDMDQRSRERVMRKFKKKQISFLVATDVAARGIDVDDLTHVINYHIPNDPESYTHRIGRTGRAGKQGVAITLITPREYRRLIVIERMTSSKIERGTLPEAHDVIQTRKQAALDSIVAKIEQEGRPLYTEMVELLIKEFPSKEVVAALIDIAFGKELIADNYRDINTTGGSVDRSGKSRLFIAKGRKDGF
jgi:ATP-dependent RNA helicase DeaD